MTAGEGGFEPEVDRLMRVDKVHIIIDRIHRGEISLAGRERDLCIFWLGGSLVAKDEGSLLLLDLLVSRHITLSEARTEEPLKWIGAISYFRRHLGLTETPEAALQKWRILDATEQEVLLAEYMREATKLGGPLNPRREPSPRDVERLKTGAAALALGEPETPAEIREQLGVLHPAIAAMQSLDDLGTDLANTKAHRDMDTLLDKYKRLEARLAETALEAARKVELQTMIDKMQSVSDAFYPAAQSTGHHAFIEFTGLMNEYIKLCREALARGIDFTTTTIHGSGQALPMQGFHRRYLDEKLQCIYGVSLDALMHQE